LAPSVPVLVLCIARARSPELVPLQPFAPSCCTPSPDRQFRCPRSTPHVACLTLVQTAHQTAPRSSYSSSLTGVRPRAAARRRSRRRSRACVPPRPSITQSTLQIASDLRSTRGIHQRRNVSFCKKVPLFLRITRTPFRSLKILTCRSFRFVLNPRLSCFCARGPSLEFRTTTPRFLYVIRF
jgi:hypothetical protein